MCKPYSTSILNLRVCVFFKNFTLALKFLKKTHSIYIICVKLIQYQKRRFVTVKKQLVFQIPI
jgi:hypothetical protein